MRILNIFFLFIMCNLLWPQISMSANQENLQKNQDEKEIILHQKIGKIISREERDYFGLFPKIKNFESAMIVQLEDNTYQLLVTVREKGILQQEHHGIEKELLQIYRKHIENFDILSEKEKRSFAINEPEHADRHYYKIPAEYQNYFSNKQWTGNSWSEESKYDGKLSLRTSGSLLGFTLGSAIGMVAGLDLKGQKIKDENRSGFPSQTTAKEKYTYKDKKATFVTGIIGGVLGATIGYFEGRSLDKKYYQTVPREFRTNSINSSGAMRTIGSFVLIGGVMSILCGYALYSPESQKNGLERIGFEESFFGYGLYSVLSFFWTSGFAHREAHYESWETEKKKSLGIRLYPLQPALISLRMPEYGSVSKRTIYGFNLLRISF